MVAQWKVIHRFSAGVDVQNPITAYQNMAVSLHYDGNKLMRIEHELDCEDGLEPGQVINTSRHHLKLFLELLRYRRGVSLPDISSVAEKLQPANGSPPVGRGFVDVAVNVLICSSIVMPDPKVFSHAPARLLVWLRLANDASDSSDAEYAIRNYYMIWEDLLQDLHPDWRIQDWPTEARELKWVRHFVSHGEKLRNHAVLDFVERELGKRIEQFDPTDMAQQQFVRSHCTSARNLVETELNKLL